VASEHLAASSTTAAAAADVGGDLRECCRERERKRRALLTERDALRDALKTTNEVGVKKGCCFVLGHILITTLLLFS